MLRLALRSVRTSRKIQLASEPMVVQVFCPLITHSPFSRRASVRRLARSEPALGWHQMSSPLRMRGRKRARCASSP